jgi:predicted nucleic acid-binding protein
MPIIIDTNCFANVFTKTSVEHAEFEPVLEWIIYGKGMVVYGGTKYKEELKKSGKYLTIFRYLREVGKVILGSDENIDAYDESIKTKNIPKEFNDTHLTAIVIETKCRIICSKDTSSVKYVTDKQYFPKHCIPPVYYTSKRNSALLCDKYVDKSLKPLCKINKKQVKRINRIL